MDPCKCYSKKVYDFIDGELKGKEKNHFEKHMEACSACSNCVRQLAALRRKLSSLPEIKTSESFHLLLRERIRRELIKKQQYGSFDGVIKRFVPVFGALAIVVTAFWLLNGQFTAEPSGSDMTAMSGINPSLPLDDNVLYVIDGLTDTSQPQEQPVSEVDLDSLKTVPQQPLHRIPVRRVSF